MTTDHPVDWRLEARTAVIVTAFVTLVGSVVGVVWHSVAPTVGLLAAVNGSSAAMKPFIGDDVWLGGLGAIAGVLCVIVLAVAAPDASRGPGALIGLAAGGILGMLVAARVGHQIGHSHVNASLQMIYRGANPAGIKRVVALLDFKVRATGVLLTWPFTSVLFGALVTWVRSVKEPTPVVVATYPVSP